MKSNIILNTDIADDNWLDSVDFDVIKTAEELKDLTFGYVAQNVEHELLEKDKIYIVNLCLSNDAEIHRLNKEFRGMDKPTNLSGQPFNNSDSKKTLHRNNPAPPLRLQPRSGLIVYTVNHAAVEIDTIQSVRIALDNILLRV